jgi:hypothetical protein
MYHIKNMNQVMTGMFLILVSLLAIYLAWPLSGRTEVGLGPGFVPRALALAQALLGAALVVNGCVNDGEESEGWQLRPLMVLVAIAFFTLTIERMGLVISVVGLVLIACSANRETRMRETFALAAGAAAFSALLFVKALGLSIPMWPINPMGG